MVLLLFVLTVVSVVVVVVVVLMLLSVWSWLFDNVRDEVDMLLNKIVLHGRVGRTSNRELEGN
eukprot:2855090-Heterocapsa_arctica.AAC.1